MRRLLGLQREADVAAVDAGITRFRSLDASTETVQGGRRALEQRVLQGQGTAGGSGAGGRDADVVLGPLAGQGADVGSVAREATRQLVDVHGDRVVARARE